MASIPKRPQKLTYTIVTADELARELEELTMFSETTRDGLYNVAVQTPPILEAAQEYVRACDQFDQLQATIRKINEELKATDDTRRQLREKLLHLVNQAIDPQPEAKARQW